MSVKGKVKRCNKEIKRLESELNVLKAKLNSIETQLNTKNNNLKRISEDYENDLEKLKLYENIIKFAITNQIGNLRGGMSIDSFSIDKMKELKLSIENDSRVRAYIMRVNYY